MRPNTRVRRLWKSASIWRSRELNLSIRDDGIGGADVSKGSGLTGLGDRVEALGGMLSISSHPGVGTELHATIPFRSSFTDPLR
jgi:signal transduction histidine kinase